MYSTKDTALEALKHCVHLDDPFHDLSCGESCPLWQQCTFEDIYVIVSDLKDILLSLPGSPESSALADKAGYILDHLDDEEFSDGESFLPFLMEVYTYFRSSCLYKE